MSITAIIPHYWPTRNGNLRQCIRALNEGTVAPTSIIIWNNGVSLDDVFPSNVKIIHSAENIGCKARFLAALCAETEYLVFQDNDLLIQKHGLHHLWTTLLTTGDSLVAFEGRTLIPNQPYERCEFVDGRQLTQVTPVDISLGRLEFCRRDTVQHLLRDFPFESSTVMDDIWFSYCAMKHRIPRLVVPYQSTLENGYVNLTQGGVGAYRNPTHMTERDQLCQWLFPDARFSLDKLPHS